MNKVICVGVLLLSALGGMSVQAFTPNDRALGLPITVAFRTVSSSVGMTYWDNAVLTVVSTNVIPPLSTTNAFSGDLDEDGLPDGWEQRYTDLSLPHPGDSRSWALSPESDNDHDGIINRDEYHHGTDPTDATDYFRLEGVTRMPDGDVIITWHSIKGQDHWVYRSHSVGPDAAWTLAELWSADKFSSYAGLADDRMGPWLIYWRQSMPGLHNRCTDHRGLPMPNWWVFLFY